MVLNSLTIDLSDCMRGSSPFPTAKTWRADIFPVQT